MAGDLECMTDDGASCAGSCPLPAAGFTNTTTPTLSHMQSQPRLSCGDAQFTGKSAEPGHWCHDARALIDVHYTRKRTPLFEFGTDLQAGAADAQDRCLRRQGELLGAPWFRAPHPDNVAAVSDASAAAEPTRLEVRLCGGARVRLSEFRLWACSAGASPPELTVQAAEAKDKAQIQAMRADVDLGSGLSQSGKLNLRLRAARADGSFAGYFFDLLSGGRKPEPLAGMLDALHVAVFAGTPGLLHRFDPPRSLLAVGHRLTNQQSFTDMSSLTVSGRVRVLCCPNHGRPYPHQFNHGPDL